MRHRAVPVIASATVVLLAGCGDATPAAAPPGSAPTTTAAADRGWIGGDPVWLADDGDGLEVPMAATGEAAADMSSTGGAPTERALESSEYASSDDGAVAEPGAQGALRAGNVDDNDDLDGFVAYLERLRSLGITTRDVDPTGRVVVRVVGTTGLPVAGAEVVVSAEGADLARLRTTADGTVRFLPRLYGSAATTFDVASGGAVATVPAGGAVELAVDGPGGATEPVAIDVLFLLDATGSMGDEIDRLKVSIDSIATRLDALESRPDLRFGMTLYRDVGDTFVTATYDFTADVGTFRSALGEVVADGGGDYPEALDEGLAEALTVPSWRDPASTVQLVFLVADAPPQVARQVDRPYPDSIRDAVARGIEIFPIASSESDDQAEAVFRQLAQATGARFVFLSYGASGAATGGSTDIDRTDYEELALDDLVVRLVAEQLAELTGDDATIPPPTTVTPPTNPDGQ